MQAESCLNTTTTRRAVLTAALTIAAVPTVVAARPKLDPLDEQAIAWIAEWVDNGGTFPLLDGPNGSKVPYYSRPIPANDRINQLNDELKGALRPRVAALVKVLPVPRDLPCF